MMAVALVGAAILTATHKTQAATSDKHKVHLTTKVVGELGVTPEDVEQACEEAISGDDLNVEFVEEAGPGVEEFTVVMQVDDADDDNDGTPDAKDPDANGDGIPDKDQVIGNVDLDKQDPELLKELGDSKPGQGINILLEGNDAKHSVIRFHTNADAPAGDKASLNHATNSFAAHAMRPLLPKWLKTTFKVISYTARFASCATGSFTTCFGLIAEGYAK